MVLKAAIARYGAPQHLRSDNGPEFIAYAIVHWLAQQKIKTIYITPGSLGERSLSFTTSCVTVHNRGTLRFPS
jgi:hypothetical protein